MGHCESNGNVKNIQNYQSESGQIINSISNYNDQESLYSIKRNKIVGETFLTDQKIKIILQQKENSICKIYKENKAIGTGFICNISNKSYNIPVLFTCNHVLNKEDIKIGKAIYLTLNEDRVKIKIKIDKYRKYYTSDEKEYDATIIEIKENHGFNFNNLLQIDNDIFKDENLSNSYKDIYVLHYPEGLISAFSHNIIKNIDIDNNTIQHLCATEEGSSGSPILCLKNYKVIGYHIGQYKNFNINLGKIIRGPIEEFIKLNYENNKGENNNLLYTVPFKIKIVFLYESKSFIKIESNLSTKIEDIFEEFALKIGIKLESLYFLCNGDKITDFKKSLKSLTKGDNYNISILVYKINELYDDIDLFKIEIEFVYNSCYVFRVKSDLNTKIEDIFKEFALKIGIKLESLCFLCNGDKIKDFKKSLKSLTKGDNSKIYILAYSIDEISDDIDLFTIEIEFIYNSCDFFMIKSDLNTKIENIFKKLALQIGIKLERLYFLYNGLKIEDYKKSLSSIIRDDDKELRRMNILVYSII